MGNNIIRVGIYDLRNPNGKDLSVQKAYEDILAKNNIPSIRLRIEQSDFWGQVRNLSLFIMRFPHHDSDLQKARDLLPIIERVHGVKCFPNLVAGWHYDDKIKQYHLLHSIGFPITESWVFYDKNAALEWVEHASYPVVFKLRGGAGSQNVILVKNKNQANRLVKRMFGRGIYPERFANLNSLRLKHFSVYRELHHIGGNLYRWSKGLDVSTNWQLQKNYVYFQKFLPNNMWDTRITVIGERAFAFRRMARQDDFRASGSGRIDYDMSKIDLRCVEIAFVISKKMGFQSMAYDFLLNENNKPEFCEVSYTYVSSAIHKCPGYWDSALNWHKGQCWPEHLHLIDALDIPDLQVPPLVY